MVEMGTLRYDQDGCSYLYDIDAHLDATGSRAGGKPFVIDATQCGNVARFINHRWCILDQFLLSFPSLLGNTEPAQPLFMLLDNLEYI